MYSKLIFAGHVGRDAELRYTPNGRAVANFSVATNRVWNNSDGEKQEETTWYRCAIWGQTAENLAQYLTKGKAVLIEGRLAPEIRVYEKKDGSYGASYELTVTSLKLMGGGSSGSAAEPEGDEGEGDSSIPF